ncbi:unnamed protein product, partial [Rhizoctonia solani]
MSSTFQFHLITGVLDHITSKAKEATLLKDVDCIEDAIAHIVLSVAPNVQEPTPSKLLPLLRTLKQYFDNAIDAYDNDREFEHYFNYFLGIGYYIHPEMSYNEKIELLHKYEKSLKEDIKRMQKEKRADTKQRRNARLKEMSNRLGLRAVGHVDDGRMPFNVHCIDAYTHAPLDNSTMLINGIDNDEPDISPLPPTTDDSRGRKASYRDDSTVPKPARDSPLPQTGFVSKDMLVDANFKFFSYGTVYGFARAPNGSYSMVWAVQFSPIGSFNEVEQQAVDVFIDYMSLAQDQGAERTLVEERHGRLLGGGWRPGRRAAEAAGEYSPQTRHDWHNPDGYIGYHEKQEPVSIAWIILHQRLSPYAVMKNIKTLAKTTLPVFGYHDSDITLHGPSLGSNMSVSMHDKSGRNFANSMHVDHDIDSLPQYYGKIFTFGQWIHTKNGKLVEGPELREAIPDGYFALPGYRVAFDLGGAAVVTAIWRGGLDMHGTTTSKVDI